MACGTDGTNIGSFLSGVDFVKSRYFDPVFDLLISKNHPIIFITYIVAVMILRLYLLYVLLLSCLDKFK